MLDTTRVCTAELRYLEYQGGVAGTKNIKTDFFLTNFLPQYPKYSGPNVTNFLQVDASIQPQGRVFTSNLCTFF